MHINNFPPSTYWAIVPAAGVGQRMDIDKPKQYLEICGKTVLEHTLDCLLTCPAINKVIVAINADDDYWPSIAKKLMAAEKILITTGGESRADSVLNGLKHIQSVAQPQDWILVHDAVRPCLTHADIAKLISCLVHHPVGGLLGVPVRDTLKRTDENNNVLTTLARENSWQALTPQMFRYQKLLQALLLAQSQNKSVTDEANAIELMGEMPLMVAGRPDNIKITYPEDLLLAEKFLCLG